jgi:hypothetical protein
VREVFIPVQCEFYALHGLALLMNTIDRVRAQFNPALQVSAVIPCQVNPRRSLTRDVLAELEKHFPGRVLKSHIRVNVRLAEAPGHSKTIFDYAPESNGAKDYAALAAEVVALPPPVPAAIFEAPIALPVVETPAAEPVMEIPIAAPEPEPMVVVETPVAVEPEPEPVVAAVVEPEPEPMEVAFASVESRTPEPMSVEAPAPAPAAVPAAAMAEPDSFAHKLAMAGLKPIVIAKKPIPGQEIKREGGLTHKLLGKLFGKK